MKKCSKKSLLDGYRFEGFFTSPELKGKAGDHEALVIPYTRRSKKQSAGHAVGARKVGTTSIHSSTAICRAVAAEFFWKSRYDGSNAGLVGA